MGKPSKRKRRKGPRPYRQGDLDGLCGVYSIINAVRLLCPELNGSDAEYLFDVIVQSLDGAVANPTARIVGGIGLRVVRCLLKEIAAELAAEYDIMLRVRRLPRNVRQSRNLSVVWQELTDSLSPTCVAIIGIYGWRSHWTVVQSAAQARLRLFDSCKMRTLRRSDCTVGKTSNRTGLSIPSVVLIERRDWPANLRRTKNA